MFFYRETPTAPIISDGLILNLDAGNSSSYPGSGTTWYDMSGNGRNAILNGAISHSSLNGGIFNLNGVDAFAVTNFNYNLTTNFTITSWFKTSILVGGKFLISKNSYFANSTTDFPFSIETIGSPANAIASKISVGNDYISDAVLSSSINIDTWYNISVSYDQSIFKLYINGNLISSANTNITLSSNSQYWTIGRAAEEVGGGIGTSFFSGSISKVLFYNRALVSEEIIQNFNADKNRFGL